MNNYSGYEMFCSECAKNLGRVTPVEERTSKIDGPSNLYTYYYCNETHGRVLGVDPIDLNAILRDYYEL